MSQISSEDKPITKAELKEFYQKIFPYLGGNKAVDSSPIGHFTYFLLPSAPAGYLACEGQTLSATAFPLLFNALKELPVETRAKWGNVDWVTEFNLPDMRGEFPRCSGNNSHANQGNGAGVGVHQDGTGFLQLSADSGEAYLGMAAYGDTNNFDKTVDIGKNWNYVKASRSSDGMRYRYTSRPTNTSLLGCVKYTYVTQEVAYSEQERVVGTWIDGSDLYEKTYSLQNNYPLPTNEWVTISEISLPLNIGLITNCDTISVQTNGVYKTTYWTGISNGQLVLENTRSTLSGFGPNGDNILEGYITIRYTKTQ